MLWSQKHDAVNRESLVVLSYADTPHSHLFTAIIIACSGDFIMIYVQYICGIKPRVTLFTTKNAARTREKFQIWLFTDISAIFVFFSCYFTGSGARKQGQVQAAFALLHFNDCLHCCHQQRKSPRFEKCKRMLLGCKHTMPHRHTHVHIIMLTHNAIKTPQTNGQECTHTCEHSCCSTIRSARYNSVVWMGSNNGALWHLNRARWRVSQEAE